MKIDRTIVQYGVVRSGSTLCYMLLKELFVNVQKQHNVNKDKGLPIVITHRDFRDSLLSQFRVIKTKQANEFQFVNKEKFEAMSQDTLNYTDLLTSLKPHQLEKRSRHFVEKYILGTRIK